MESIIRAAFMYFFLLFIVRTTGARTLSEMSTFDFVLLMIIGDASQQAILSNDFSITNAVIVITTFMVINYVLSFLKHRFRKVERILDGSPLVLISDGKLNKKMMEFTQVDENEILSAARQAHGFSTLEKIRYAVLEKDGIITIIPYEK